MNIIAKRFGALICRVSGRHYWLRKPSAAQKQCKRCGLVADVKRRLPK